MQAGEDTAFRIRSVYQRELEPGDAVFDEGDPGDQLYVIQAGRIELTRDGGLGQRVVAHLGPGDFFGELGVVTGGPRTTRAEAVSPTRLIAFDRETLEAMCMEQPEIAIRMIRVLVSRLIEAERRLAVLGVDGLLRPVVRALVRRGEPDGTGLRVALRLRELAEDAGLSMLEAHRALHQLFDKKVVQLVEDCLVVPDPDALAEAAE